MKDRQMSKRNTDHPLRRVVREECKTWLMVLVVVAVYVSAKGMM